MHRKLADQVNIYIYIYSYPKTWKTTFSAGSWRCQTKAREAVSHCRWLDALLCGGRLVYTTGITQIYQNIFMVPWLQWAPYYWPEEWLKHSNVNSLHCSAWNDCKLEKMSSLACGNFDNQGAFQTSRFKEIDRLHSWFQSCVNKEILQRNFMWSGRFCFQFCI